MSDIELFNDKTACCACGACLNICPKRAIAMRQDENGFLYPQIDPALCVGCGLCKSVCAYQCASVASAQPETFAAAAGDVDLSQSASGGLFASLAQAVLTQGGAVYGCAMEQTDGQLAARHICAETPQALARLKGSKYVQSETGRIYQDVQEKLLAGRMVLFSGTPCQVDGLKGFLRKDYGNLFTVDIICHGVPSLQLFRDYLQHAQGKVGGKITGFHFRDKRFGWKLHGCMLVEKETGKTEPVYFEPEESSYYQMFLNSYTYRENCYSCPYACSSRPGDVTIGDFWNIDLVHPQYLKENGGQLEEKKGISCLVVNSDRGQELLRRFGSGIVMKRSSYEEASRYNAQLTRPSAMRAERDVVLGLYRESGYAAVERWYRKRLRKIRLIRAVRAAVPRWVKDTIKKLLGRK